MNEHYRVVHKEVGETPLQALERLRESDATLADLPMTYAGRLDPMAEGKLLILVGDECKKRHEYLGLDKEYEYEVLLGFKSDTGDVLGIPERGTSLVPTEKKIRRVFESFVGAHRFPYPQYSSKNIATENMDAELKLMRIYSNELSDIRMVSSSELLSYVVEKLGRLRADASDRAMQNDFRRAEILAAWESLLGHDEGSYLIAKGRAVVTSGTYIRTLSERIAEKLGTRGLALSIYRARMGRYVALGPLHFWLTSY